jgi:hypothetical protein
MMATMAGACGGTIVEPSGTSNSTSTSTGSGASTGAGASPSVVIERLSVAGVNKIDLLLAVDNSASMADKQQLLARAVPDLIGGFVNPPCLDSTTNAPIAMQPATPTDNCPLGSKRAFPPILDMHVGLVSSSLGTFGADGCPDKPPASCPTADTTPNDDHGHLVTRSDICDSKGPIPTYQSEGFLAWDPTQMLAPPGIATIGSIGTAGPGSGSGIVGALNDLVVGNGQQGCGFESQNESWYRFLIDPTPYQSISLQNNVVVTNGIDQALLKQRQEFLRPDSLLAIVLLSDEDDCSLKEYSSYPLFAAPELHLPHPRQDCFTKGPTDPCCASCGQATPNGCAPDPMCSSSPTYTGADESSQLRAFGLISHKERYGIEFFYQPTRYVDALQSQTVVDINGKMVPNPIYSNLDPTHYNGPVRDSGLVFYTAIVGVPWQLIARQDKNGTPDLIAGFDNTQVPSAPSGGFKSAKELTLTDSHGNIFWDDIAGDPENYVPAKSPFMFESTTPRAGTDPITGIAISPTTTANGAGNPLNDHEWTISTPANDIEYACIFPLPTPIDESNGTTSGDCGGNPPNNPLCSPNPADPQGPTRHTLQTKAKAYPGLKHLAIARGMASQGIVGSICPAQLADASKPDFGYRPSIRALIDRVSQALHPECFPRKLTPNAQGQVACVVLEGTANTPCVCDPTRARSPVPLADQPLVQAAQQSPGGATLTCFCEIDQDATPDCETSATASSNGWCYVDASEGPGAAQIVAKCPASEQQLLRFVGTGNPQAGATLFLSCQ